MSDAAPTSERRWAVLVRHYWWGELVDGSPFMAGRFYFNRCGDRRSDEDHPPTATFKTRAQARVRCAKIRSSDPLWRTTAVAVPVVVTTTPLAAPRPGVIPSKNSGLQPFHRRGPTTTPH